jgi:uncharacterized lipoprotein YajG
MKYTFLILATAVLTGCATPAAVEQMAVSIPTAQKNLKLAKAVGVVEVTGGRDTNPLWTSQISSDGFRRALEQSLESAGMLSKLSAGSEYQLTADLTRVDQPIMGFDMTVTATVRYSLIDSKTRKEVYGRVINIPYTATTSDAFIGSTRLRLANEGAIRENIKAFINDLVSLKL